MKVELWLEGHLGEVELLTIPRKEERVVDSQGRHFVVESVQHLAVLDAPLIPHAVSKAIYPEPRVRLWVREY
jgi:hypothetical protein